MNEEEKLLIIQKYLDEILPDAGCELTYSSDYGFLISVMLSAQCTDKKVNAVTEPFFAKYKSLKEVDNLSIEEIEKRIKPLGLYKNKAKNIKGITHDLITKFDGKVPEDKEKLTSLPGVGNKTANVVRAELFKIPEFPVDTHVERVSKRLGLVNENDDVLKIEKKLQRLFDENKWIKLHHQFIHFGRYYCKAISPKCDECKLRGICKKTPQK